MATDRAPTSAGRTRRLLQCAACGQVAECLPEDLLVYTRTGWPRCCGEVMALFVESGKPTVADTKLDHPPLPPGPGPPRGGGPAG